MRLGLLILLFFVAACSKPPASLTVAALESPADSLTSLPFLTTDRDGNVFLSWIERHSDTSRFLYSQLKSDVWSTSYQISKGTTWFINWADYPMLAAEGTNRVAHLLDRRGEGKYAYDVKVSTSTNGGDSWKQPFVLHDDGKEAEHGFVSLVPYEGNVFVAWLDGRNMEMEGMESTKAMDHSSHGGTMTLRAALLNYAGEKLQEWELDSKTCDCCQTAAAITQNGPVVVYRDRSDEEIRDISIVRLVDGKWTAPQPIHRDNWKIAGCPVNGPRITAKDNQLAVAWFTAATEPARVNVVFSADGGENFAEPVSVDDGKAIGRVDIEWIDAKRVVVTWMEGPLIQAAVVHRDGTRENPVTIATSSDVRSSGFPQMTLLGKNLVFAWTDDKQKRVKTAILEIN